MLGGFSISHAEFVPPSLSGPVVDEVSLLSSSDRQAIDQTLRAYKERGRGQIQVVIVPSLQGVGIEEAALKTFETWKLGLGGRDDGILFFVAFNDRKMRIEVGRFFEGALPDVVAKRILDDQVVPLFRAKRFSEGIVVGVSEILHRVDEEFANGAPLAARTGPGWKDFLVFFGWGGLFVVILILRELSSGGPTRRYRGGGWGGGGPWIGGGGGGGWGGGSGGGWSGGGGGSAGGGASSGW